MSKAPTDPFRIRDHVAEFESYVAQYRARSAQTLSSLRSGGTVAYGAHPDETIDLFFPQAQPRANLPVHMFIHGGYWRAFSKRDYAFVADTITAAGAIAAIVDYSLMPKARMATLVDQVRRAATWLHVEAGTFGGDPRALSISGHSAGGHLAAMACVAGTNVPVRSVLCVSGLFDLAPLLTSFLQAEVHLTPAEVAAFSPLRLAYDLSVPFDIMVGAGETAPFHQQADAFADHLHHAGSEVERTTLVAEQHMSIVLALGTPGTSAAQRLAQCISRSRTGRTD